MNVGYGNENTFIRVQISLVTAKLSWRAFPTNCLKGNDNDDEGQQYHCVTYHSD